MQIMLSTWTCTALTCKIFRPATFGQQSVKVLR